ncbi:Acetylornithine deacetylase/Succinyl-diaminopimelate desuccinylase [Ekhidna lutea]|uniref:Acetylornithine deacetylase/Succinyl-diaminopimelate desuccinylase n=1 Tax=Ekhidna lutea TaxID=447679 RepID=A0A239LC65_EKHLU|nr:M20/M25/M40 family metallo-hydrolase [Ekhidna lutea]SNT28226.1 Acetylornithine deacetylase/Succinyl-diaminopimelate desuccinylase [Ekhidna lutea]
MRFISTFFILIVFSTTAQDINKLTEEHIQENGVQILQDFKTLLSMPNVAFDLPNINKNANHIISELEKREVETKLLRMVGTPPIVYGYYPVESATRTIAFYVHYDGQPVDKTNWTNDPWEPTYYSKAIFESGERMEFPTSFDQINEEHRIYARSAGDDKAPIITILTALDMIQSNEIKVTSNLVFFFEGQEEAGSRQLQQYLNDNRALVDEIDLWLFCDGPIHQSRRPQLVFGVRGVTGMEITTYGPNRPLHSGHYGNWAPVPGQLLSELIASMKDEEGNVIIDGFYDDVEPLSDLEKEALANIPPIDEDLKRELGINNPEGTESYNERLLRPSLTIKGLSSGNTGKLARNVVPATATAAIGMRLVKGCDPEKQKDLVEAHILKQGFHIVREDPDQETRMKYPKIAKVTRSGGYPAARTSMDIPIVQDVIARSKDVAGDDLILMPTLGGSLPLYLFTDELKKPAIILPIANHDNNQHAADENMRIGNLWYGIKLMSALMTMN